MQDASAAAIRVRRQISDRREVERADVEVNRQSARAAASAPGSTHSIDGYRLNHEPAVAHSAA